MMICISDPWVASGRGANQFQLDVACAERSDVRILLTGGVDKRAVARAIHARSRRAHAPFLTINCARISDARLEAKLFGRAPGAAGAKRGTRGCLEQAHCGTIFMANISALSPRLQARLMEFLESGEIRRVGDSRVRARVDVRVISSAGRRLLGHIANMRFHEDLFYRLNVMHLVVPPNRHHGHLAN